MSNKFMGGKGAKPFTPLPKTMLAISPKGLDKVRKVWYNECVTRNERGKPNGRNHTTTHYPTDY